MKEEPHLCWSYNGKPPETGNIGAEYLRICKKYPCVGVGMYMLENECKILRYLIKYVVLAFG